MGSTQITFGYGATPALQSTLKLGLEQLHTMSRGILPVGKSFHSVGLVVVRRTVDRGDLLIYLFQTGDFKRKPPSVDAAMINPGSPRSFQGPKGTGISGANHTVQ